MNREEFTSCMTVRQLKRIVKDLPEQDGNGEEAEAWVMVGPTSSSPITSVSQLNSSDIVFGNVDAPA